MALVALKHIHVYKRPQEDDILFGWATRTADTDALVQWNGSGWTELYSLPGTDLVYDSRTWINMVFFCDGKNGLWYYDVENNTLCLITTAPVVQYLEVFQEHLVGAGDARTRSEIEATTSPITGDPLVWPADSNRDRVLWSEALDFNRWSPNNFIDAQTGTGEVISGLGVNSITSADRGAQSQLVVFKPSATMINDGVLGSGDQRLNFVSRVVGCPGYHSVVNTPFGLMFCGKEGVYAMNTDPKEPNQIGFYISPDIKETEATTTASFAVQRWFAAIFHDNTYKLSYALDLDSTTNDREFWLDLRPQIFPNEQLWYGPHTGDTILQYAIYAGDLVGAEMGTTNMWKLDVEGVYGSMADPVTPRTSTMIWPRLASENMARGNPSW